MELDQERLKEKALLLLQRERELFDLRTKHERVTAWLNLAQALPQIFADPNATLDIVFARLRKALLEGLKVQRVSFLALEPEGLRPIAPAGPLRPLSAEMRALLLGEAVGVVNDQSGPDGANGAADLFGLTRFIWTRIDLAGGARVVLVAGYDASKAKFFSGFDSGDAANLRNTGQHIHGLIGNAMLAKELQAANETLEQRVVERTTQLERRNRDMRLVLDNVVTALATIDSEGRLAEERSATLDEWFGAFAGTPRFVDYIAKADPAFAETFAVAHEALVEGFMPRELCLHQLPSRIQSGGRTFQCAYRSISGGAGDGGLLIIIEDVTERLRLAQDEAEQSELLAVFQSLTRDRAGFLTFFEEAGRMVQDLASGTLDDVVRKRHLHTLKGNAAMVGAKVVADLCHRAEEELAIDGTGIGAIVARLQGRWRAIGATLQSVLGGRDQEQVEIPAAALDQLRKDVLAGASPREIERRLTSFEREPIERPLGRLANYATAVATRLGKGDLSVQIESDGSRLDPQRFVPLWASLVHLIRNGVDHGIEAPSERLAHGKPPGGRLILRGRQVGAAVIIEVEDDGSGIDWDAVVKVAKARGLPHETPSDLLSVVLSDGFSTRAHASSTSGRGVGMAAVSQAVASLGGALSVRSQRGVGTCWRAVLPLTSEGLAPVALGLERGPGNAPDQFFARGTQP